MLYEYEARDPKSGELVRAQIEAPNERSAAKIVTDKGLAPLDIKLKGGLGQGKSFFHRIPTKQKVIFSRQLSTLVSAGLPLVQSLESVRDQSSNKNLQAVINRVITDVEGGATLSDAMARHPEVFSEIYVALIAAGETSGTLDKALERLADQQEKDAEIVSKIRGAMVYPIIVLTVLVGIVIFLLVTILPQVQNLYNDLPGHQELPFVTKLLLSASNFIRHLWWLVIVLLIAWVVIGRRWARTTHGRSIIDSFKIRAWAIGPLYMKFYMARFTRTASILVASGVPMIKMLNTASRSIGNVHVEAAIKEATEKVKNGKNLSESIKDNPYVLDLVPKMIGIGEKSGSLGGMLEKVADYYEKEIDNQIKAISTTIEPIMMILVGIMAMIVVAAVLLPIYSLAGKNLVQQ